MLSALNGALFLLVDDEIKFPQQARAWVGVEKDLQLEVLGSGSTGFLYQRLRRNLATAFVRRLVTFEEHGRRTDNFL